MKNIYLEITPFFPTNESFRGPYIFDQVKALQNTTNYEIIVIKLVSIFEKCSTFYKYQDIKVYSFKVIDLPSSILPGLFNKLNFYRFKKFILNEIKIDFNDIKYIHSHVVYPAGMIGVSLGKNYNIKNFIQHHGFDVFQKDNGQILKGQFRNLNYHFMYKKFIQIVNKTDLNIGVSQKVINTLNNINGYSNKNNYVLYNGVDTQKFYRLDHVVKNQVFTIGCIANFWELKDHITLLKALKVLVDAGEKDILIKFIGSGRTLNDCKEFIISNNLENYIEFSKELDHKELNTFYNSLDLFVLPSYSEAFGCVYAEALQVGIPIIAVKNQGIEEVLTNTDKKSMLISKKDYQDLTTKILQFKHQKIHVCDYDLDINTHINNFITFLEGTYND